MSKEEQPIEQEDIQGVLADLARLEKEFEKVDVDILRETTIRQAPLFTQRDAVTSQVRNFWPLAFEQAAATLAFDEYITPEDAHVIGKFLRGISVTRPDAAEPRTIQIELEFAPNDYFEDRVLRKTFVYQSGGSGLCSEPVAIAWKDSKDLTEGVTAAAIAAFAERKAAKGEGKGEKERRLEKMMAQGPSSFFNWFLWTGSHEALGEVHEHEHDHDHCNGHDHEEEGPVEVFPNGEEMAVQIAEDLYPNAPKYFTDSIDDEGDEDEEDDIDLESDVDDEENALAILAHISKKGKRNGIEEDGPAKKKPRK